MSHLGTDLGPLVGGGVAVGKLNEVDAVVDEGLQLVHRGMGIKSVLELAGQSHAEHGQGLGADVLAELEELEEAQTVALVVVAVVAIVEGVLPAVAVGGPVLHGTH